MRSLLYYSLSLLMVFDLSRVNGQDENFCDSEAVVSRAFIIERDIYFGDEEKHWKMNVENFRISDKEDYGNTFGENIELKVFTTAVYFGQIECQTNCQEINKAKGLALVIGNIQADGDPRNTGFKAYRKQPNMDPTAIEDQSKMPWDLTIEAKLMGGDFWVQEVNRYEGMTFDDMSKTIYMATVKEDKNIIYSRKLTEEGKFETEFRPFQAQKTYTGLIAWKGKIYGLADNKFILLSSGNDLTENEEFSAKRFFNCESGNPSPLMEIFENPTTFGDNLEANNTDNGTELHSPAEVPQTQPEETDTPSKEDVPTPELPSTTSKSESKSNWIIWVIVVLVIIVVIILIVCCLLCCKKSDKGEGADPESRKSKPDSKIVSEGGSKVGSKVSSKDGTSRTPSSSQSLKSGSAESSGGSQALRKASSKSEIEAMPSVRSKTEV